MLTLFYPFNGIVWACSVSAFLFVFLALYLNNLRTHISMFRAMELVVSPLLREVGAKKNLTFHKSWYGYVVFYVWSICAILISFAYTSNLLANLTVVERSKPDNTFEVLYHNIFHGGRTTGPRDYWSQKTTGPRGQLVPINWSQRTTGPKTLLGPIFCPKQLDAKTH